MTGYGKTIAELEEITVSVEVKSLNAKSLDIYCRLPRYLSSKEIEVRNMINAELERGKVDIFINVLKTGEVESNTKVNRPIVAAYLTDLTATFGKIENPNDKIELYKLALTMPNALSNEALPESASEKEWQLVKQTVQTALAECNVFRMREGAVLSNLFGDYIASIADKLQKIREQDLVRIPAIRERLLKAVADLTNDESFDKNRFEQELIYYLEKFDISEEKVRLATHLDYFLEVLANEGNGKKINFISQEIGREINTIGSKANDAIIQRLIVEMKDELEKIKEQSMNTL